MADAGVEIQFIATGAENTQKNIAQIQMQLKRLAQMIQQMPKLDVGKTLGGEQINFAKETWKEFHRMFAGLEEEIALVNDSIKRLSDTMVKKGVGGASANTAAINRLSKALVENANTNEMLHEVLIGEAPLNVKINKTRREIAVTTKEASAQNKAFATSTKKVGVSAMDANRLLMLVSPTLSGIVFQVRAVINAFRAMISTPIGILFSALAVSALAVYKAITMLNSASLDRLKSSFDSLNKRIESARANLRNTLDLLGQRRDIEKIGATAGTSAEALSASEQAYERSQSERFRASRLQGEIAEDEVHLKKMNKERIKEVVKKLSGLQKQALFNRGWDFSMNSYEKIMNAWELEDLTNEQISIFRAQEEKENALRKEIDQKRKELEVATNLSEHAQKRGDELLKQGRVLDVDEARARGSQAMQQQSLLKSAEGESFNRWFSQFARKSSREDLLSSLGTEGEKAAYMTQALKELNESIKKNQEELASGTAKTAEEMKALTATLKEQIQEARSLGLSIRELELSEITSRSERAKEERLILNERLKMTLDMSKNLSGGKLTESMRQLLNTVQMPKYERDVDNRKLVALERIVENTNPENKERFSYAKAF